MTAPRFCADNEATARGAPLLDGGFTVLRRSSAFVSAIALLLAVLLPFTAAHCLWMGTSSAHAKTKCALHACCQKAAAREAAQGRTPAGGRTTSDALSSCCTQLPAGIDVTKAQLPAPNVTVLTLVTIALFAADAPTLVERFEAGVHDPHGAPELHAHQLRGPPALG